MGMGWRSVGLGLAAGALVGAALTAPYYYGYGYPGYGYADYGYGYPAYAYGSAYPDYAYDYGYAAPAVGYSSYGYLPHRHWDNTYAYRAHGYAHRPIYAAAHGLRYHH